MNCNLSFLLAVNLFTTPLAFAEEEGFVSLFDGKTVEWLDFGSGIGG